jgi:hypothetical protein
LQSLERAGECPSAAAMNQRLPILPAYSLRVFRIFAAVQDLSLD